MKSFTVIILTILLFPSCKVAPRPIEPGRNDCDYCKMTVTDIRFACEILTTKGKTYIFDDIHCMAAFVKENSVDKSKIKDFYLSDYSGDHHLVNAKDCMLYESEDLHSPMGGNMAAFSEKQSMISTMQKLKGQQVVFDNLLK